MWHDFFFKYINYFCEDSRVWGHTQPCFFQECIYQPIHSQQGQGWCHRGAESSAVFERERCMLRHMSTSPRPMGGMASGGRASASLHPGQTALLTTRKPRLNLRLISPTLMELTKKVGGGLFFWWSTERKSSMSLGFVPFLVWLFSCDIERTSSLLPKGICPFYLGRRVLQLFAFLNCLAAQACSVCAVWNVSPRHVTAVLELMLDFLQQIWIMLKSVLNWRGYVNNSQMGISVLSSRGTQAVYGRSKCLAGPSFRH